MRNEARRQDRSGRDVFVREIEFQDEDTQASLRGALALPASPRGIVIFAHGSGSSRASPRNRSVARFLQEARLATLLLDLLTEEESHVAGAAFDLPTLARRLEIATDWIQQARGLRDLPIAYFGASTGAAAALMAAARSGARVRSIVSRGGRPDLAGEQTLRRVQAPTLLIVGSRDPEVLELNEDAAKFLPHARLVVVPGATHLFEEPGALDQVATHARSWILDH